MKRFKRKPPWLAVLISGGMLNLILAFLHPMVPVLWFTAFVTLVVWVPAETRRLRYRKSFAKSTARGESDRPLSSGKSQ